MKYADMLEVEKIIDELIEIKAHEYKGKLLKNHLSPIFDSVKNRERKEKLGLRRQFEEFDPMLEIARLSNIISNCNPFYEKAKQTLDTIDRMRQDLLHLIEFIETDKEEDLLLYSKQLKQISEQRRVIKNFIYLCEPLKELTEQLNKEIAKIKKSHSEIMKRNDNIITSSYKIKEMNDLEPEFIKHGIKINK